MEFYLYKAKAIRIVDGDTFEALIDVGFNIHWKGMVRLYGIDAPEIRSKTVEEKGRAIKATARLRQLIVDRGLILKSFEWGKYGRCIAKIWVDEPILHNSINDILVEEGHAIYKEY